MRPDKLKRFADVWCAHYRAHFSAEADPKEVFLSLKKMMKDDEDYTDEEWEASIMEVFSKDSGRPVSKLAWGEVAP